MTPYEIAVGQDVLDDLSARLARTRWPRGPKGSTWEYGTDLRYLKELCSYWRDDFDWPAQEAALNTFHHYRVPIDGLGIHFIQEHGEGAGAMPILLTHGFPDSFARFLKVIPLLTAADPDGFSFDVVVPSIPGYGFSNMPSEAGLTFRIGGLWKLLMVDALGYPRFAAHGGDWGSSITEQLLHSDSDHLFGAHLTDVPFAHMFQKPDDATAAERKYLTKMEDFQKKDGAYAMIQGTRPSTLAPGLNDSPAGLASWLVEKFRAWSDCDGDVEKRFTKDELIVHVMIYWATGTIGSSFLPYYDAANAGSMRWMAEKAKEWIGPKPAPAAFAMFPKDLVPAPREWAQRFFDVRRWTEMKRGGHFAAMEEPELLADDIRAFFKPMWSAREP